VAGPVRARQLSDEEGRRLLQIVRRGKHGLVRVRRGMIIMASASGTRVPAIARLVAAGEDTVRHVIHLFSAKGLAALDLRWAGGRARLISDEDIEVIVAAARTRPEKLGQHRRHGTRCFHGCYRCPGRPAPRTRPHPRANDSNAGAAQGPDRRPHSQPGNDHRAWFETAKVRRAHAGPPGSCRAVRRVWLMLDSLTLPPLPALHGERVIVRGRRDSDVDDRLRHPIDPEEEDGYGSSWRREWDGRRYHTREYLTATSSPPDPRTYAWMAEYDGHCIGSAGLEVNPGQHYAEYTVGLFVAALRGRGLGREVTRLVLAWAFDVLGVHRVELQVLAANSRAINCYLACGFRQEGVRREAELYPDGWKDFIMMGILRSEHAAQAGI
jgi:RimJ/RimL family protein N-acetyltransferase